MAQNFLSHNRHIIGTSYGIGNKIIIDRKCNFRIPKSQITALNGIFNSDLCVGSELFVNTIKNKQAGHIQIQETQFSDGTLSADNVFAKIKSKGSIGANKIKTNKIIEKDIGHGIVVKNNIDVKSNLDAKLVCAPNAIIGNIHASGNDGEIEFDSTKIEFNGNLIVAKTLCANLFSVNEIHPKNIDGNIIVKSDINIDGNVVVERNVNLGSFCASSISTNYISAKPPTGNNAQHNIVFKDNLDIWGNVHIGGSKLFVDQIMEFTPVHGVCIGSNAGDCVLFGTTNPGHLPTMGDQTQTVGDDCACGIVDDLVPFGDRMWQSFRVKIECPLRKINADIVRAPGFENKPMGIKLYKGIGIGNGSSTLLGSVFECNYNFGQTTDVSSLGVVLDPECDYTILFDYPIGNPKNYLWKGHKSGDGDPKSSRPGVTFHLDLFTISDGGLKVGVVNTCVENRLKLNFPDANCEIQFMDVEPLNPLDFFVDSCGKIVQNQNGLYGNGLIELKITCDGQEQTKILSFDHIPDNENDVILDNPKLTVVGNTIVGNVLKTDTITTKLLVGNKFIGNLQGNFCNDTIIQGNLVHNQLIIPDADARCIYVGQDDFKNGGFQIVGNAQTYCLRESVQIGVCDTSIIIGNSDCITFDLNGHCIHGVPGSMNSTAFQLIGNTNTIIIKNGTIRDVHNGITGMGTQHDNTIISDLIFENVDCVVEMTPFPGPFDGLCINNTKVNATNPNEPSMILVENGTRFEMDVGLLKNCITHVMDTNEIVIQNLDIQNDVSIPSALEFINCNRLNVDNINITGSQFGIMDVGGVGGVNHTITDINVKCSDLRGIVLESINNFKLINACVSGTVTSFEVDNGNTGVIVNCSSQTAQESGFLVQSSDNVCIKECSAQLGLVGFTMSSTGIMEKCVAKANLDFGFNIISRQHYLKFLQCCAMSNGIGFFDQSGAPNVYLSNAALYNGIADYSVIAPITIVNADNSATPLDSINTSTTNFWTNVRTLTPL